MQRLAPATLCAALSALAAGCAADGADRAESDRYAPADASAEQGECFNTRFINGFSEVDRDTVRIRVNRDDYYDVNVTGACTDLDWTNRLVLTTRSRSNLCVGPALGDAEIVTREDRCSILSIEHSPRRPAADSDITPFTPED